MHQWDSVFANIGVFKRGAKRHISHAVGSSSPSPFFYLCAVLPRARPYFSVDRQTQWMAFPYFLCRVRIWRRIEAGCRMCRRRNVPVFHEIVFNFHWRASSKTWKRNLFLLWVTANSTSIGRKPLGLLSIYLLKNETSAQTSWPLKYSNDATEKRGLIWFWKQTSQKPRRLRDASFEIE